MKMNAVQFREIMRGPYVSGLGYVGWSAEHVSPYLADFEKALPKLMNPLLKRNKKSYTLTWEDAGSLFRAILSLEEDPFGGPVYHHDEMVVLSNTITINKEAKGTAKKSDTKKKTKATAKKIASKPAAKTETKEPWKAAENPDLLLRTHVLPLFYYLCLTKPPKGVVFL